MSSKEDWRNLFAKIDIDRDSTKQHLKDLYAMFWKLEEKLELSRIRYSIVTGECNLIQDSSDGKPVHHVECCNHCQLQVRYAQLNDEETPFADAVLEGLRQVNEKTK